MTYPGCGKTKSGKPRKHTPIVSRKQQGAMGVAYALKKGEKLKRRPNSAVRQLAKSMTQDELRRHLKESKGKKLPEKARKRKR